MRNIRYASSVARGIFSQPTSLPRRFPKSGYRNVDNVEKLEEENWDWYSPRAFYPTRIGEIFRSRYQILGKLGYGAHSTAWLCRDLCAHKYMTLKICERDSTSSDRELAAYNYLNTLTSSNVGALLIRQLHDSFKIPNQGGEHLCLVHEPLGMSIETFRQLMPEQQLSEELLKAVLKHLFQALDCLHSDAQMVHTDLQARNIHLRIDHDGILKDFEQGEMDNPSPRKDNGGCLIYESRGLKLDKKAGPPVLCDFGEARYGSESYQDLIQPSVYRAPEVILDIPWSFPADIWNVGVMTWDLFENKHIFHAQGQNGDQYSEHRLAEMVAVLGPPPLEFLRRSETSWTYFNPDGSWKAASEIPDISLEMSEERLQGANKVLFLDFIRKMLEWIPENRQTARQLLDDPWLKR